MKDEEDKMSAVEASRRTMDFKRGFTRGYNEGYNVAIQVYLKYFELQINPMKIKVDKENIKFVVCKKCNKLENDT